MNDTPRMNTIRAAWVKAHPFPFTTDVEERYAEFDRWLADHDMEVRAQTLVAARHIAQVRDSGQPGEQSCEHQYGNICVKCGTAPDLMDRLRESLTTTPSAPTVQFVYPQSEPS